MEIRVKSITGEIISLDVSPSDTIKSVKDMIRKKGVDQKDPLQLYKQEQELQDDHSLHNYNLVDKNVIFLAPSHDKVGFFIKLKVDGPGYAHFQEIMYSGYLVHWNQIGLMLKFGKLYLILNVKFLKDSIISS